MDSETESSSDEVDSRRRALDSRTRTISAQSVFVPIPAESTALPSNRVYESSESCSGSSRIPELATDAVNLINVLVVGGIGVGKTSFVARASNGSFQAERMHGVHINVRTKWVNFSHIILPRTLEKPLAIKVQLWDVVTNTGAMAKSNYRGRRGIFLCFDVSNRISLQPVEEWWDGIARYSDLDAVVILVGLKADSSLVQTDGQEEVSSSVDSLSPLRREVSFEEGVALAVKLGVPYLECSAKDDLHVQDALATLVYHVLYRIQHPQTVQTHVEYIWPWSAPAPPVPGRPDHSICSIS